MVTSAIEWRAMLGCRRLQIPISLVASTVEGCAMLGCRRHQSTTSVAASVNEWSATKRCRRHQIPISVVTSTVDGCAIWGCRRHQSQISAVKSAENASSVISTPKVVEDFVPSYPLHLLFFDISDVKILLISLLPWMRPWILEFEASGFRIFLRILQSA
jgi:hypothetical protein